MRCESYSGNSLPSRSFCSLLPDYLLAAALFFAPRPHAHSLRYHHAPSKSPQRRDVSLIVTRKIDGRFQDECASSELRMFQNHSKRVEPDLPFSDVLVP